MKINNISIRAANLNDVGGISTLISQLGYPLSFDEMYQVLQTYLKSLI